MLVTRFQTSCIRCLPLCVWSLQDGVVIDRISEYFKKAIAEIAWDDEDVFIDVLNKTQ